MSKGITTRDKDFSEWYNELVSKADLAEHSAVRGCMVIKPNGFSIWEKMQAALDKMFKDTGHQNAYFPIFIPKSFLSKEAQHVKGFASECAVVTHYRLKNDGNNNIIVDPEAKLEEELIVRPTSETIIWNSYKNWIQSYRDLPILINQWANVVRWEMRTRLFLRTAEFLWQEGHTAHATKEEAIEEAQMILDIYAEFVEKWLAIPVIKGVKTESERFAGALDTYCIETLMQDGRALQAGTSHFLGQNFAKAFDVKFLNKTGGLDYVWATSWGVSTRLMGALIMSHSDDQGLVLPPKLANKHVVIIPIYKNDKDLEDIRKVSDTLIQQLKEKDIVAFFDDNNEKRPGFKFADYEMKGMPIRLVIGRKDIDNQSVEIFRRDTRKKSNISLGQVPEIVSKNLDDMQNDMLERAREKMQANIRYADNFTDFKKILEKQGGFIAAHWDGTPETEAKIKAETKATIRCIPLNNKQEKGTCIYSGKPSKERVLFAKAY